MIERTQQTAWVEAQSTLLELPLASPGFVDRLRARARGSLEDLPLLDRRSEAWRYSRAERVLQHNYVPARGGARLDAAYLADMAIPLLPDAWRLVFFNGSLQPELSDLQDLPDGVGLGGLQQALSDASGLAGWLGRVAPSGDNLFTALNTGWMDRGVLLRLGPGVRLERPVQLVHITDGAGEALLSQPRHLVVLEEGASATLVEHYQGEGEYFLNHLSEILLGAGAALTHYRVQQESAAARHLSSLYLRQLAASHYQGCTLSFGSAWARCDYNVRLDGEGADCDLFGLYLAGDAKLDDFHLDIRHHVPGCRSQERFKGIAWGRGRAVFDGRVLVQRQAQRSDAMLKNDNLVLGRDAEVDTKPQLEIYADDVRCGHGTTVGQLEPEQLFYLRSRGIAPAAARRILCEGFAAEVLERLAPDTLREHAYAQLAAILANVTGEA